MKKLLILSNVVFLFSSVLLGFLLLDAKTQLRDSSMQNVLVPAPVSLPAPTSSGVQHAGDTLLFIKPIGTLPVKCMQKFCNSASPLPSKDLESDNPIDSLFDEYWPNLHTTMEENAMAGDYMDCWKAEMLHAYGLLKEMANPSVEYLREELEDGEKAMLEFAKSDSALFATVLHTDAYGDEGGSYGESVFPGSGWPGFLCIAQAAHYRAYTLYLYDLLSVLWVQPDFVFNSNMMEDTWGYLVE